MFVDSVAEWRLLGSLLREEGMKYLTKITDAFFTDDRSPVWRHIQQAYLQYGTISVDGLLNTMKGNIPGELYAVPDNVDVPAVFDNCLRLAKKRAVKDLSDEMKSLSDQYDPSLDKIRDLIDEMVVVQEYDSSLKTAALQFITEVNDKRTGVYKFANTGLPFLNKYFGGEWPPQTLVVIGAGAGGGKTSLVSNSILRMVYDLKTREIKKDPVIPLFFSLEMTKKNLFLKWAADLNDIDSFKINTGALKDYEMDAINETVQLLQRLPIYVVDEGKISIMEMAKITRDHVKKHGVKVSFVDYLQIINHRPTNREVDDLGDAAYRLRELGKELNICQVALSQVNRQEEGLNAIRGSGIVGQHADAVVILKAKEDDATIRTIDVDFCKNRLGPTGKIFVHFAGPFQRFESF
jgi:replicative DNA helicase